MSDFIPDGYWRLNEVYTNGNIIVVLGTPLDSEELGIPDDDPQNHSCDEMGCSSVGNHVLCHLTIANPHPALLWTRLVDDE